MPRIKLHELSAKNAPSGDNPISMVAHVIGLLPQGGRRVRLSNNHEMDVLREGGRSAEISLIGDIVTITIAPGQLHGWRLT